MKKHGVLYAAAHAMARLLAVVLPCLAIAALPQASAQPREARQERASAPAFTTFAFHNVVDTRDQLDDDAITADRLVSFFDWLRSNGWTVISLDDVSRAAQGEKSLPARAVLLSFDDGYESLYTRVYPLALAYGYPIVSALVGDWMIPAAGSKVHYGNREVPRETFITWDQAREMQRSGLVEFALHSRSLHQEVIGNPQGNTLPSAVTRSYAPELGYQSEAALAQAVHADLEAGRALIQRELGRPPRALAWPYGRYNDIGTRVARSLGFEFAFTLDGGPSSPGAPFAIARYLPTYNPSLMDLTRNLTPDPNDSRIDRLTCLDPGTLWNDDTSTSNEALGRAIERARALGITGLVVDAVRRDAQGRIVAAWFPTAELPNAGDWLSRISWQMRTRAELKVYIRLPHRDALAALGDPARVRRLYADLGSMVPMDGWVLEAAHAPVPATRFEEPAPLLEHLPGASIGTSPWVVRGRRQAVQASLASGTGPDALGWQAFAALDAARPGLELLWLVPSDASAASARQLADVSLVTVALDDALADDLLAHVDPRLTYWFTGNAPPGASVLRRTALAYQQRGAISVGWCPDNALEDLPAAAEVAPGVSAQRFPLRP